MKIPDNIIQQCFDHGLECYPEESCGFISGPEGENPESFSVHPMENIINRLHQQDPENHPRSAKDGYMIDPLEQLKLERQLKESSHQIRVIYHSHPDVGAYFSEKDIEDALWDGLPRYPDILYLVCGVRKGKEDGAILAEFDQQTGSFNTITLC